jgi:hypothetical protein
MNTDGIVGILGRERPERMQVIVQYHHGVSVSYGLSDHGEPGIFSRP